jgi:hypothetical protein
MQVSNSLLIVAVELYLLLVIGVLVLFFYSRKQKKLISRQQQKLLEVIKEIRVTNNQPIKPVIEKGYKFYINQQLETTQKRFNNINPAGDIAAAQSGDANIEQQILALRYAFLRSEELGTTEDTGSNKYWSIFQQTLEPLLQKSDSNLADELEIYKKRVENLEKFKKLFFELEAQWNNAHNNSENYHAQLLAISNQVLDPEAYELLLQNYQGSFGQFAQAVQQTANLVNDQDPKTINIIRQDPRAAEEIVKLRNVAADQYRVINNLQRKLEEATTDAQKSLVIQELEQQLQRQIRFVQESDTCVQLLEDELIRANEKIIEQEHLIDNVQKIDEENSQIKDTLHSFTMESRDLLVSIESLEEENLQLKEQLKSSTGNNINSDSKDSQRALIQLQKQYAELEEKYLALKLK